MALETLTHMIYFEVEGSAFAVNAADLAGVSHSCAYAVYPGLPEGVAGVVQWGGKIFPVIDAATLLAGQDFRTDLSRCTFLFSVELSGGRFPEFALAVPGNVRAFFAEGLFAPPAQAPSCISGVATDKARIEAQILDLGAVKDAA